VPDSHPTDFDIHRLKGILVTEDGSEKIIQAVRDVFEIRDPESAPAAERKMQCKIVLIGRGLGPDAQPWQRSLEAFLERAD
jgi:G3E family GTPase